MDTAPTDGRPIILRNDAWTHDIVAQWVRLDAYGVEDEDGEEFGWIWAEIAIAKTSGAAFDFDQIATGAMHKTKWAPFVITEEARHKIEEWASIQSRSAH